MTYFILFIRRAMLDVGCSTFIALFALSFCLMTQDCFATQWAKTYGGNASDAGGPLALTSDGGYIVAGMTWSFGAGGWDAWITKLDQDGILSWESSYGGIYFNTAQSIQQTGDGGYIVGGVFHLFSNDMWILKLDSGGAITWQKRFGGSNHDRVLDIQQTSDGGYIVAGVFDLLNDADDFSGDMVILKIDSGGAITWQKTYGGSEKDSAYSIQQTSDGGYVVAGYTRSFGAGEEDIWILKLDQEGAVTWQKTYGGEKKEFANVIQQTTDGGYIVCGYGYAGPGDTAGSFWVLKLAPDGTVTWQKSYGSESGTDIASTIQQTGDGGYIVGGYKSHPINATEMWILKLDADGNVGSTYPGTWQKTYQGNSEYDYDYVNTVRQTGDGGYIVGGTVDRDAAFTGATGDRAILKLDSNGDINNCESIEDTTVTGVDTGVIGTDSAATISTPSLTVVDTTAEVHDTTADVEEQCFAPDWFPTVPPSQDKLNGVWGYLSSLSNHEFYAVGEEGKIIHFDGTEWSSTGSPTMDDLYGIWGSSETDIFAVGDNSTIVRYNAGWVNMTHSLPSVTLYDVWGSSSSDLYAVGDGGFIAYYDGASWSEVTSPASETLTGIWGSSASDYVAVGEEGTVITYDGSWTAVTPSPATEDLSEVWGSSSNDIYAVGKGGTIIHYDGNDWDPITSPTSANLKGIWGSSGNNIFAVGEHGTILYYDGSSWTKLDSGSQDRLISTFGTLNPRVMVVGYDGTILDLSGPSVQGKISDSCTGAGIENVTVDFDKSIAGGAGLEHQIAQTDEDGIYAPIPSQGGPYPLLLTATGYFTKEITVDLPYNRSIVDHATYLVPASGYQECISGTVIRKALVGPEGFQKENSRGVQNMEVKLYQGDTEIESTVTDVGGNYHFTGLSSGSYSVEPVITGSACAATPLEYVGITIPLVSQCDGASTPPWCSYSFELTCPETPPSTGNYWEALESNTNSLLHGIWGSSGDNIFAVGNEGTILHYDGSSWTQKTSGTENNLMGVWGSSANDVYAVGEAGTVLKTTTGGTNWSPLSSTVPYGLNAIWGSTASDIFAVGDEGVIIHSSTGTSWTVMNSHTGVKLLGVWGNSGSDVYAVGNSHVDGYVKRTVIHYDGAEWAEVAAGNGVTLMSTWGDGVDDITATGSFGSIMRYDGIRWKQSGGPTEKTFNGMWGTSGSNIFAVGFNGVIAHYDGVEWSVRETEDKNELFGIWGASGTEIYAVGDNGKIFAYRGDEDNDGQADETDNCPEIANQYQEDGDGDGLGDACDNCPGHPNGADDRTCRTGSVGTFCVSDEDCGVVVEGVCESTICTSGLVGTSCENDDDCDKLGYCPPVQADIWDGDGVGDACDNCLYTDNEEQENGDGDSYGDACDNCPSETNEDQTDTFPPQGNNCGDACECEGNFDGDEDVDGGDAAAFKADFGRSQFKNPCNTEPVCKGNFDCDLDVDGTDASTFKTDFGRSGFKNPCPSCVTEPWCTY